MDKEEAVVEFLKGLRVAFNNASAYPKAHPYFLKSAEVFKQKVDTLLVFLNPIKINIAPDILNIEGKNYERLTLYVELASMFHFRKIKSIQISQGVTINELVYFLNKVSLPIREILRGGGFRNILNQESNPHITLEELDYSLLLGEGGEELKDIWVYLFKEAVVAQDAAGVKRLTDNFEKIIANFKLSDLTDDEEIRSNIDKFLSFLKDRQKDKFDQCIKEIFTNITKYKDILSDENIEKIKIYFKHLNEKDFADILCGQILANEHFDSLGFSLFSRLAGEEKKEGICSFLLKKNSGGENLVSNPKAVKKIKDLLSLPQQGLVSGVYQHTLSLLLDNISFDNSLAFDRAALDINYRFLLINLLEIEKNEEKLSLIIEKLRSEIEEMIKEKDFSGLGPLIEVLRLKKKENPSLITQFEVLEQFIFQFLEISILEDGLPEGTADLSDSINKSSLDAKFYLDGIFLEHKINPQILKLFFKFFPYALPDFYKNLSNRASNIEFIEKIISNLKGLNDILALEVFKNIFSFSSQFIKIHVLKTMQNLQKIDAEFLIPILQSREVALKREACVAIIKDNELKKRAISALLDIPNFLGFKNNIILENLQIIAELGIKEASDNLLALSEAPFFWNSKLRNKARDILGKWNVR